MPAEKSIKWVGTSLKDLLDFPDVAKREAGYQLHRVQNGLEPENWKPFRSVGVGVKEIRINEDGDSFRVMYVATFPDAIYVLHSFWKKSRKTNNKDIKIAKTRYDAIANKQKSRKDDE
ncbi:MAG: type II toxin-antitoxin system RelE/ParE family toxin [Proteobacteria bacterium]|nr:type II toxin-antitoxin system RelE/ParE family toxin [Pseudomonadota bacterium]